MKVYRIILDRFHSCNKYSGPDLYIYGQHIVIFVLNSDLVPSPPTTTLAFNRVLGWAGVCENQRPVCKRCERIPNSKLGQKSCILNRNLVQPEHCSKRHNDLPETRHNYMHGFGFADKARVLNFLEIESINFL